LNKHRNIIDLISFSSDGKYLISRSRSETIVWETKTWKDIITIDQDVGIVTSSSRRLKAFIHDGIYKPWNIELLRDFYDEIKIEDEEED
jgi:WD40 repeat protein